MKRPLKILLVAAGACVALVALLVALAFTPAVQTWVVRRAVADVPGVKIEVGRAALGLHSVRLDNVRVEQPGLVLTLPAAEVELPLADAIKGRVAISRLVAKGWTLDLTGAAPAKSATPAGAFDGVFKFLKLPVTLTLEQAELEGDVVQAGGKTHVTLSGGGLGARREGGFKIATAHTATAADAPAKTATASAELTVSMDGAGAINGLALAADVAAAGPKINGEARARITVSARRDAAGGEIYEAGVRSGSRELVSLEAALPAGGGALSGKWTVDAGDADLAPLRQFLPAGPLPVLAAKGQGTFTASRDLKNLSAAGKIAGSAEKLEALRPELAAMGRVEFAADFDAEERAGVTRVTRFGVTLGNTQRIAIVETLQAFEFDRTKAELKAANPAVELARVRFGSVPLAWVTPFLPSGLKLDGDIDEAQIVVSARDRGFALIVERLMVSGQISDRSGLLGQGRIVAVRPITASYSPEGWQAEIMEIGAASILDWNTPPALKLRLTGRVGQKTGKHEPVKFEGTYSSQLEFLRDLLPRQVSQWPVLAGVAEGSAVASIAEKTSIAVKLNLRNLAMARTESVLAGDVRALPDLSLDLRADIAADGGIALNAPLTLTRAGRKSDLTLGGTFTPTKAGWTFDAQVAGDTLHVDDLQALAALAPESSAPKPTGTPWAGLSGSVKFAVKRMVFSPTYAGSLAGTLLLDGSGPRLDAYGALDGPTPSPFTAKAGISHTPGTAAPYALTADVELRDFQLGALRNTLEASVNLGLRVTSRAATPDALAAAAQGRFQLSSKGGVTRLLAKSAPLQIVGTGAALIGAFTGNSTAGTVSRGVARISDLLQEIRFDQLNVLFSRDASNDLVLEDFTLVAPEVRLTGKGRVKSVPDRELTELPLALTFQLAARGTVGEGLRGLGLIAAQPDALGYYPLAFDPEIGGTLGSPDKTPFYNQLLQRALTALVGGTPAPAPAAPAGGSTGPTVEGLLKEAAGGLLNGLLK